MKIYSWNINGIRAWIKKPEAQTFLKSGKADILCVQEIKISDESRAKEFPANLMGETIFSEYGYIEYWNSAKRPGYSGTLTLIKKDLVTGLLNVKTGLGIDKFDVEGRTQTLEFKDFYLINNYFPNSNHELSRLDYKIEYNQALHKLVKKLEKKKPVIITGDLNVAHNEIDLARPKDNHGNPGFTKEEREWMTIFLDDNMVDTFRDLHPKKVQYSWWSYRAMVRERNIGWRIDYFVVSKKLIKKIKKAKIHDNIWGSDHCPISIEI
ncbi:MAG: exodeoxyribonuclease III [Candidatus Pacebacteria bacterium]|nr:exodeoxyribonuclease III [Candidatus Paceibacterota bacterium]